ncbi:hypothetical protein CHS0354_031016 [Potamilus streckersoni]|uniref:Laminin G domain-containing protein n=1 Tax=Potamilus streckersoni TaxID=2493646 RepID=A0AAE0TCS4_9BIVA|nr:hypothetical protein CHS0354_031016 [Potamilus streckersoni]
MKICSFNLLVYEIIVFLICLLSKSDIVHGRHCRSSIDALSSTAVKIEPIKTSRLSFDSLSAELHDGETLTFEFKTTSDSGILFYTTRRNDLYDVVSVVLRNGYLQYKIRCKTSHADLMVPGVLVNDGEWHTLVFARKQNKAFIKLDDKTHFRQYYVTCGGFTSVGFGGINPDHDGGSSSIDELKVQSGHFSGCIRNVNISTGIDAPPHYVTVSDCH